VRKIYFLLIIFFASFSSYAGTTCVGQFMNPISDVCWDCAFPIKIWNKPIIKGSQGEDYTTAPNSLMCACAMPPRTGFPVSFWEFTRQVDVTKEAYCMVGLGTKMDLGVNSNMDGGRSNTDPDNAGAVFRQVHLYVNPLLGLMGAVLDAKCLEPKGYTIPYTSELDGTWHNDEWARFMSPDAYLFNNIIAQLICAGDCIAASSGLISISQTLFWCAGCNGSLYPLSGWDGAADGAIQGSSLFVQRLLTKAHRSGTQFTSVGKDAWCGPGNREMTMDKRQYKYTMVFPVPQAELKPSGLGGASNLSCCQPFGKTTAFWGSGRVIPYKGEDQSYGIFRKRDCCQ
jgi:conjugal transfer pilus assembly protein TraU